MSDLTFVSTFSGCGGFDLGFTQEGFRCVGAFDIDPVPLSVHHANIGASTSVRDLSHGLKVDFPERPDVLLAGSPCQGFSTLGERRLDDPRNSLLGVAGEIALTLRPNVFIAENVAGVTFGQHKKYWNALVDALRSGGYQVASLKAHGVDFGIPQVRCRAVLVAWLPEVMCEPFVEYMDGGVIRDALTSIGSAPNHYLNYLKEGSNSQKIASRIKQGQKLCNVRGGPASLHTWEIPEVFGRTNAMERQLLNTILRERRRNRVRKNGDADPVTLSRLTAIEGISAAEAIVTLKQKGFVRQIGRRYDLTHSFNGKFKRLAWDNPSPAVDTMFGDPRFFLHPDENRGFSVREAARLQGFPDSFVFAGTLREQFKMIGNAVPPPLGAALARWVRSALGDRIRSGRAA